MKRLAPRVVLVLCGIIASLCGSSSVMAAGNATIENKALADSIVQCYNIGAFKKTITVGDESRTDFNKNSGAARFIDRGAVDGKFGGINGYLAKDVYTTCLDFFNALDKTSTLKAEDLTKLGYNKTVIDTTTGSCVTPYFFHDNADGSTGEFMHDTICATFGEDGETIEEIKVKRTQKVINNFTFLTFSNDEFGGVLDLGCSGVGADDGHPVQCGDPIIYKGMKWDTFKEALTDKLGNNGVKGSPIVVRERYGEDDALDFYYGRLNEEPITETKAEYTLKDNRIARRSGTEFFTGMKYSGPPSFSKVERFVTYQNYLKKYYDATIDCSDASDVQKQENIQNGGKEINFYDGNDVKKCFAFSPKNSTDKINGFKGQYFEIENCDYECVVDWLSKNSVSKDELAGYDIATSTGRPKKESSGEGASMEESCKNAQGSEALGWILCPLLSWMSGAADKVYTEYVEPELMVEPELFTGEGDSSVRGAWETFRDIANVAFIILLLAVIFSQLTGVGIDNYGIKKVLPRLIVAAILINLSYLICEVLVDVSNILGNGLQGIFRGLSNGLGLTQDAVNLEIENAIAGEFGEFDPSGLLAGLGVLGVVAGAVGAIWLNPGVLISLLVAALGVLVAIFFLFVLLGARKAGIVVLTVLSPLAVVMYMLPNTKKLYDKWWKIFEGLLLVYPIAGLLVGAGDYVSRLLLSVSNNFPTWLMAMVVSVAPIFFIPKVLKNSFVAMGKVGATIAGLGTAARGKTTRTLRNTEGYKNAQRRSLEHRARVKAGLDKNGNLTRRGRLRLAGLDKLRNSKIAGVPILGAGVRGMTDSMTKNKAALIAQAKKDIGASEEAVAVASGALATTGIAGAQALDDDLGATFGEHTVGAYYGNRFLQAASSNNITGMNAALEAMRKAGMKPKDIAKLVRHAQNHEYFSGMDDNKRAAWFGDLANKYGNDFLATDFELNHFLMMRGSANGGVLGDYGTYAQNAPINIDEIKPEDLVKLSGDSLAGMAAAGKISQGMAQRVMAMNPNISEDKKIMFGALADGAARGNTYEYDADGKLRRDTNGNAIVSNTGTIGGDAAVFKKDAEKLMTDHGATTSTIQGTREGMVERWVANTAQDTILRDVNYSRNEGGRQTSAVETDFTEDGRADTAMRQTAANTDKAAKSLENIDDNTLQSAVGIDEVNEALQNHTKAAMNAAVVNLDNETLAEVATNPKAEKNDPLRSAAEEEIDRRVQDGKMDSSWKS